MSDWLDQRWTVNLSVLFTDLPLAERPAASLVADFIGVCVGTSGPAGTDMITGLYGAWADSVPILCITGQAPVARLQRRTSRRSTSRPSLSR